MWSYSYFKIVNIQEACSHRRTEQNNKAIMPMMLSLSDYISAKTFCVFLYILCAYYVFSWGQLSMQFCALLSCF